MHAMLYAILFCLCAGNAVAHDQSLHKGHPTEGQVASVSGQGFVLDTEKGIVTVTVVETTKIERGEEVVSQGAIRVGDHASVFGTKLESGELVAKQIIIGPPSDHHHTP